MYEQLEGYNDMDCCKEAAAQRAKVRVWAVIGFSLGVFSLALVLALASLLWAQHAHASPWLMATALTPEMQEEATASVMPKLPAFPTPPEDLRVVPPEQDEFDEIPPCDEDLL